MIDTELLDSILLEWSYRLKDGIPDLGDPDKLDILNTMLTEMKLPLFEDNAFKLGKATDTANFIIKYYDKWMSFISNGTPFRTITGKEFIIPIKSPFYSKFKAAAGNPKALEALFKTDAGKYGNVIPGPGSDLIRLTDVSKAPFTTKVSTTGTSDLNTEDGKEGLAAYFYALSETQLKMVEAKCKRQQVKWTKLNTSKLDPKLLKPKAVHVVEQIVTFLNEHETLTVKDNEAEILACLQAISVARRMKELCGEGMIVDRGETIFADVQKAATKITGLSGNLIDKWCPGDVYVYSQSDISAIKKIIAESESNSTIVSVGKKTIGLNSLFDTKNPKITAVSLKEAKAFAGAATSFVGMQSLTGTEINTNTTPATAEEKKMLAALIKAGTKSIKGITTYISKYEKEHAACIKKLEASIKKTTKGVSVTFTAGNAKVGAGEMDQNTKLFNLINKVIALRKMDSFFSNFDKIKSAFATRYNSTIMSNYDNPLEALTAYGVGLSGFNPTFYKIQADAKGAPGHVDIFKGRDSLDLASKDIIIVDPPTKAGYQIKYDSKMGEKLYSTKLDIRFKGALQLTITVQEFKEK